MSADPLYHPLTPACRGMGQIACGGAITVSVDFQYDCQWNFYLFRAFSVVVLTSHSMGQLYLQYWGQFPAVSNLVSDEKDHQRVIRRANGSCRPKRTPASSLSCLSWTCHLHPRLYSARWRLAAGWTHLKRWADWYGLMCQQSSRSTSSCDSGQH